MLFDRKIRGLIPQQRFTVRTEQRTQIVPRRSTNYAMPDVVHPQHVADGKCAAIRNHRRVAELQKFMDQRRLFVNARVSVLIAVDGMTEQRKPPQFFINDGEQSYVNHHRSLRRIVSASALCDVRRFERVVAADSIFTDDSIAFDSVVVRAFEQHMRGIVVEFAERNFEFSCNVQSDSSENRVPLIEEGVERSSEPVVVHLLDGDAEVDIRSGLFGPFRNVGHRHGRVESGAEHQTEYGPMIKLRLLICGDVLVDDLFEFDSFEHRRDHGQLSKITTLNILGFSIASKCIHALGLAVSAGSASLSPVYL